MVYLLTPYIDPAKSLERVSNAEDKSSYSD